MGQAIAARLLPLSCHLLLPEPQAKSGDWNPAGAIRLNGLGFEAN